MRPVLPLLALLLLVLTGLGIWGLRSGSGQVTTPSTTPDAKPKTPPSTARAIPQPARTRLPEGTGSSSSTKLIPEPAPSPPPPLVCRGTLLVPPGLEHIQRIGWDLDFGPYRTEGIQRLQTRWLPGRRFEIRGAIDGERSLRIRPAPGEYLPLPALTVPWGKTDVLIQLRAAAAIQASFLVDDIEIRSDLSITLHRAGENTPATPRRMFPGLGNRNALQATGPRRLSFRRTGLQPGRYHFRLGCRGNPKPLFQLTDLELQASGGSDPRLKDIDLRGTMQEVDLLVRDDRGLPCKVANARILLSSQDGRHWHAVDLVAGRAQFRVLGKARIRTWVPGFAVSQHDDLEGRCEIRLRPAPTIRAKIRWPRALPKWVQVDLRMQPTQDPRARIHSESPLGPRRSAPAAAVLSASAPVNARGVAELRARIHGPHRLFLELSKLGGRPRTLIALTPKSMQIDGRLLQEITIDVDAVRLKRLLEFLEED